MAFELHRTPPFPGIAASAINVGQAVKQDTGDTQRSFVPIATQNIEPFGVARASAPTPGDGVSIYDRTHVVRAVAAASLGAGADIGVATTNGALAIVSGASGVTTWSVGKSLTAAAAGETFSLYVNPRQLSGLLAA